MQQFKVLQRSFARLFGRATLSYQSRLDYVHMMAGAHLRLYCMFP
jgi:hypothetical protein